MNGHMAVRVLACEQSSFTDPRYVQGSIVSLILPDVSPTFPVLPALLGHKIRTSIGIVITQPVLSPAVELKTPYSVPCMRIWMLRCFE